jgi:hypothetical protein
MCYTSSCPAMVYVWPRLPSGIKALIWTARRLNLRHLWRNLCLYGKSNWALSALCHVLLFCSCDLTLATAVFQPLDIAMP